MKIKTQSNAIAAAIGILCFINIAVVLSDTTVKDANKANYSETFEYFHGMITHETTTLRSSGLPKIFAEGNLIVR